MDEHILEAASALCLSPRRRDRSKRDVLLKPLAASRQVNGGATPSSFKSIAKLATATGESDSSMPRGVKRSRRESAAGHAESSVGASDSPSPSKMVKHDTNRAGLNADEAIVISDSDDDGDGLADGQSIVETMPQAQEEDEDEQEEDVSPSALHRQNLANLFTYRSPTKKSSAIRQADPDILSKGQTLKHESKSTEPLKPPTSPTKPSSTLKTDTTASSSAAESSLSARKKSKAAKGTPRATLQLKKTLEAAKAAGVAPLDLERVLSAGFRLIVRCSFCAGPFAKSTPAKAKQEHMSLCAPLQGVEQSATAVDTISSDITRALRREEQDRKKASDQRTVLQDVMHDADIVMHEGRASQIAASPKKRGKDKVVTKKAIKRSTRPTVLVAEDASAECSPAPPSVAHSLLPARKAMQAARDMANQLLGSAISLKAESSKSETVDEELKAEGQTQLSELLSTPKKARRALILQAHDSEHAADLFDPDEIVDQERHLPMVSAEQVFASMSASSPHKSPVKALQKSREGLSRSRDMSSTSGGSNKSPRSPGLPQTQPFAPSKLAQRRQTRGDTAREKLFGAQTTTRSLLDLMRNKRDEESCDTSSEFKRKAGDDDDHPALSSVHTKKAKLSDAELDPHWADVDSMQSDNSRSFAACISGDDDMDVDDQVDRKRPSTGVGTSTGKLQDGISHKTSHGSANGAADTDEHDERTSPPLQQTALNGCSAKPQHAAFDQGGDEMTPIGADSLDEDLSEEDDDEDTQSFLDLLEPLEVMDASVVSPTHTLSDPLSDDDMDEAGPPDTALRSRRMLVACGGASTTTEPRRNGDRSALPSSSSLTQKASPANAARQSSVSDSDPDLAPTDDGCDDSSSPQR
ncbi:conserved hypothetical protein [Sporisorium reilianum SRZ2]|uniref:Uncharacterized protein n=1 Tax=Sporisorium reilianum (strain SRZ2) TaxID=999809 RepID=E6ZWW7_SPORE|nr:conserved hypothetical protein [Sporisorium reilianum SRZ2]